MKVGIVGFQGCGKTTIFNALTGLTAPTGPHGGENKVHLGVIKVPDPCLEGLARMLRIGQTAHVEITFVDFPPGRGEHVLDPNVLQHMKEVDALAQVVRCFASPFVPGPPSPLKELQDFQAELKLADLLIIENRLARLKKEKGRTGEQELLERCKVCLESEVPLRTFLTEEEDRLLSGFGFLSPRPVLVLPNASEEDLGKGLPDDLKKYLDREGLHAVPLCGKVEMELAELEEGERRAFLQELGLEEPATQRFVRTSYAMMDLISFLTHNQEEVRAWSVRRGTSALKAAGKVHSDMERGFIRAEVVGYEDFARYGSEAKCKEAGKLRLEGKDYIVQDGDIIRFRFHV